MKIKRLLTSAVVCAGLLVGFTALAETHVANDRNGVPGLKISINDARIRHSGEEIVIYPVFEAVGKHKIGTLCIDNGQYARIDDDALQTYMPNVLVEVPEDGDPYAGYMELNSVPINAKAFTTLKIVGRAPDSEKAGNGNYYGDFEYKFTNLPIPQFHQTSPDGTKPGGMFTDNDLQLAVKNVERQGGDLVVEYTLTNVGKSDKNLRAEDGNATTTDGDRLKVTVKMPGDIAAGDTVKGYLTISGGADAELKSVKQPFYLIDKRLNFRPQLILRW